MKLSKFGDYEKIVEFPVWAKHKVHVIFTKCITDSKKARYKKLEDLENARAIHIISDDGHSHLIFHIDLTDEGVIAHESWHCIRAMLYEYDAELDNETVAYHLQYLVERVHKFWNVVKFSVRKKPYESK